MSRNIYLRSENNARYAGSVSFAALGGPERVAHFEAQGMPTGDAQAAAEAEEMLARKHGIVAIDGDDWECMCGNRSVGSGFYAYAGRGREAVPDDSWPGLMFCADCARVFDPETGVVVSRPDQVLMLDGTVVSRA